MSIKRELEIIRDFIVTHTPVGHPDGAAALDALVKIQERENINKKPIVRRPKRQEYYTMAETSVILNYSYGYIVALVQMDKIPYVEKNGEKLVLGGFVDGVENEKDGTLPQRIDRYLRKVEKGEVK